MWQRSVAAATPPTHIPLSRCRPRQSGQQPCPQMGPLHGVLAARPPRLWIGQPLTLQRVSRCGPLALRLSLRVTNGSAGGARKSEGVAVVEQGWSKNRGGGRGGETFPVSADLRSSSEANRSARDPCNVLRIWMV